MTACMSAFSKKEPIEPLHPLPFEPVLAAIPNLQGVAVREHTKGRAIRWEDAVMRKARWVAEHIGEDFRSVHRRINRARISGLTPVAADEWAAIVDRHPLELWDQIEWDRACIAWDAQLQLRMWWRAEGRST